MTNEAYRYGVIGVFIDQRQQVLVCERSNMPGSWQFPQGGIDDGEDPETAVRREMMEELGTTKFKLIKSAAGMTTYDFPPDAAFPLAKLFRGQNHYWFLLQFEHDAKPSLELSDGEFCAFKWTDIQSIVDNVVDWKRAAYAEGLKLLGLLG